MILSTQTDRVFNILGIAKGTEIYAKSGYDALDYSMFQSSRFNNFNACEVRKIAESNGLIYNQAHAPFPSRNLGNEEADKAIYENIKRSIEFAQKLGARVIVVHPFCTPDPSKQLEENLKFYSSLIQYISSEIKIAIENMWNIDSKRGYIIPAVCSFGKDLVEYYDALDPKYFTVCLDLGHSGLIGEEASDAIRALGNRRLTALHIHDNNYKSDTHTMPFMGNMNWNDITSALKDIEYKGDFTYEADRFLYGFDEASLPIAVRFMADIGRELIRRIESN